MPVNVYRYTEYVNNGHTFFRIEYVCLFSSNLNKTSSKNKEGKILVKNNDNDVIVVVNTIGKLVVTIITRSMSIMLIIIMI